MAVARTSVQTDPRSRAIHALKFYYSLDKSNYQEWRIVALFYSAVHLIELHYDSRASTSSFRIPSPKSHWEREAYINSQVELGAVKSSYTTLKTASEEVRYKGRTHPLDDAQRKIIHYLNLFKTIDNEIGRVLSTAPIISVTVAAGPTDSSSAASGPTGSATKPI